MNDEFNIYFFKIKKGKIQVCILFVLEGGTEEEQGTEPAETWTHCNRQFKSPQRMRDHLYTRNPEQR